MLDGDFLWELIERRAKATPEDLFAVNEAGRSQSFAEYRDAALRCAAGLAELGIGAGTAVSWQLPTRFEALILCAALARLGAQQNPLLPMLRQRELKFIARQTNAHFLFAPRMFRGFNYEALARGVARELPGLSVWITDDGLPGGDPAALPPAPAASNEVRWVLYSSGTTADPKGVRHGDPALAGAGRAMVQHYQLRPEDRHGFVFPVTHIGGINWLFAGLMAGCAHILIEQFGGESIALLAQHGATLAGAGTVFHQTYLAAQRAHPEAKLLPRVRCYPGGGAPKPPQLYHDLLRETGAPIVSGYGLTEYPIATLGAPGDPGEALAESEGRATDGCQLRIVRPNGAAAQTGEEGEVRLRGPHMFCGYVDARLDADAFDADGFLRTGDLGSVDEAGFLRITGRLKDVIVRKGENVSAREIEDLLHEQPKIAEAAVIGLPDAARGELVCAVVAPRKAEDPPRFEEMNAALRKSGLAMQKLPERLEIVAALPRNASGKVLKRELQRRYG